MIGPPTYMFFTGRDQAELLPVLKHHLQVSSLLLLLCGCCCAVVVLDAVVVLEAVVVIDNLSSCASRDWIRLTNFLFSNISK